jgi:hypothetical protein
MIEASRFKLIDCLLICYAVQVGPRSSPNTLEDASR